MESQLLLRLSSEIDKAWDAKRYDDVLSLLQQDSLYPGGFNLDNLPDGSPLKDFVLEMIKLHDHVGNGDLPEVKKITSRYKSEFYLNPKSQSAAFTALKNRQFHIYAYLKSIGVVLDDEEKKLIEYLEGPEKEALREKLRSYFPADDDSLISYLTVKSESINPPDDFRKIVREYYTELNTKIPGILKVVRYENNLEIIFDHKDEDVIGVCFIERGYGAALPVEKTIYLGSRREKYKVLGTLAHELTHIAMEIVFKNDCKPYEATNARGKEEFEEMRKYVWKDFTGDEADIIKRVLNYNQNYHHSELIVRVPQILAGFENGEDWLQKNVPDLLRFYQEKVLPKCEEFVSRSFLIKPRSMIQTLNEKFGEISSLIKCKLFFENVDFLESFLNLQKISFLITKNTRLGLLRILQALYRKSYVNYHDSFILFKFQNSLNFFTDIQIAFSSEATDLLILDCESVNGSVLKEGIFEIIAGLGTDKKIIFVAEENQAEIIQAISQKDWGLKHDENFSLNDLDPESQKAILKKEIIFQETKTTLGKFGEDEDFRKLINSDVIGQLISDRKHQIGSKIFGISSLEGSYAQIVQEVNISSLLREIETSNGIFVFMGDKNKLRMLNLEDVNEVDLTNYVVVSKKILWTERNFEDDFKRFCKSNPLKKVYLINMNEGFILQQIYNPDFYMKRKIREISINPKKMDQMISSSREKFIFTGDANLIQNLENKYSNVNGDFNPEGITHWFLVRKDVLIWKNSHPHFGSLSKYVSEELSAKNLIEENDLVKDIVDRKVVIISDEPGMGKSTTITKLYQSALIVRKHWIIRINLKDCLNIIKKLPSSDFTIKDVIYFLQGVESKSNNTLTNFFFDLVLDPKKTFSKYLLLIFDGFDELLDEEDRNNTIRLLQYLKMETKSKIWIASRLHYKWLLQVKFQTFALQFDPIDNDMKREFIKKYYKDRLNLILSEEEFSDVFNEGTKLRIYVENYVKKMEAIFQENLSTILGTPLQLNLLLDNSTEYFRKWLGSQSENLNFSYLGSDPFEVYESYIDRKYKVYFKKKHIKENQVRMLIKLGLERYHKNLTMNFFDGGIILQDLKEYEPSILLIGLVQLQNENLQFFHFTFREFYCAKILVEFLTDNTNEKNNSIEKLLTEVVEKSGYKLIRRFIDCQLRKVDPKKINPKNLKPIGVMKSSPLPPKNFFSRWMSPTEVKTDFSGMPLHVNILESNSYIFDTLFSYLKSCYCKSYGDLIKISGESVNLLHSAGVSGNLRIWDILFETMGKLTVGKQKEIMLIKSVGKETILHVVAKNRHPYILKKLLERIKLLFSGIELQKYFTGESKNVLKLAILQNNSEVINILLKNAEEILPLDERKKFFAVGNETDQNVLFLAVEQEDPEILQLLLVESGKILSKDQRTFFMAEITGEIGRNLLLLAVKKNNAQITELLLRAAEEILSPQERITFFMTENVFFQNALFLAADKNNFEIIEMLTGEAEKMLFDEEQRTKFFMAGDGKIGNVLLLAAKRNDVKLMEILLKIAEKLITKNMKKFFMSKNSKNGNVFSLVEENNPEVMGLLLQWAGKILSPEELMDMRRNK